MAAKTHDDTHRHCSQVRSCAGAGLMVGPALLGWIADLTSVQTALAANAAVLVAATAYFGLAARETRHLRAKHAQA